VINKKIELLAASKNLLEDVEFYEFELVIPGKVSATINTFFVPLF
jgi:hypothetical protein